MELERSTRILIHQLLIKNRDQQREMAANFWARDMTEWPEIHVRRMAARYLDTMAKAEMALRDFEDNLPLAYAK